MISRIGNPRGGCRPRGSVLLEVLLSIVIVTTSMTVIVEALASSARASVATEEYLAAEMLFMNELSMHLADGQIAYPYHTETSQVITGRRFTVTTQTQPLAKGPYLRTCGFDPTALTEVAVTVSWPSRREKRVMTVTTYVFADRYVR